MTEKPTLATSSAQAAEAAIELAKRDTPWDKPDPRITPYTETEHDAVRTMGS